MMIKRIACAALALSLLGSTAASAAPWGHGGFHGGWHHGGWHGGGPLFLGVGLGLLAFGAIAADAHEDAIERDRYERERAYEQDRDYREHYQGDDRGYGPDRGHDDRDYRSNGPDGDRDGPPPPHRGAYRDAPPPQQDGDRDDARVAPHPLHQNDGDDDN